MPSGTTRKVRGVLVAVDTNVLVRLLVSDDLVQQRAVLKRLQSLEGAGDEALVVTTVLAELAWVLESLYGYGREDIVRAVEGLMSTSPFSVEDPIVVADALRSFRAGGAGFSDCLIVSTARRRGATKLLTFDRKLLRQTYCERP